MNKIILCAVGAVILLCLPPALAGAAPPDPSWGIGIGLRWSESPFSTGDRRVYDVVPLLYYDDEHFFLRELEGGVKLLTRESVRVSALMRYRFFDFPRHAVPGNGIDGGLQVRHALYRNWSMRWELLSDAASRFYLEAGPEWRVGDEAGALMVYAGALFKSARFNTRFYGLDETDLGAGTDWRVRIEGRIRIAEDWHLLTRFSGTYFDGETFASPVLQDRMAWDVFAGVAFLRFGPEPPASRPEDGSYWRTAFARSTRARLTNIATGGATRDPERQSLVSLFYGHPLSRLMFGLPLDVYLTPGIALHHHSELQESSPEYVVALKAYYTLPWSVRVRLGAAEGLSYVRKVPYVERTNVEARGHKPSNFMNFLDFSADVNVGDLFSSPRAKNIWFGYGVHHRSGIFANSSQFGRVSGGSNYQQLYLQYHF